MLERVSNALKVFGEEYLTRIYRLAANRFQLGELDATITRKLATIESIYQKLTNRANTTRMEVLEWVVIVLIASEIALGLLRPCRGDERAGVGYRLSAVSYQLRYRMRLSGIGY
jgi:hypothetical protein